MPDQLTRDVHEHAVSFRVLAHGMQIDERMNGDGAGIPLGVNEPILGFVMLGVFTAVWVLYAVTAKDFGGQEEEDGLSL